MARIKSLMRRSQLAECVSTEKNGHCVTFGEWVLDTRTHMLFDREQRAISLTHAEYRLLQLFLEQPFTVLEREYLLSRLGLNKEEGLEHRLDVHVSRLRQRLGDTDRKYIKTAHNTGYMFVADIEVSGEGIPCLAEDGKIGTHRGEGQGIGMRRGDGQG